MSKFEDIFQPCTAEELRKRRKKYPLWFLPQCQPLMIFSTPAPDPIWMKERERRNEIIRNWFALPEFAVTSRHTSIGLITKCTA